jgi:hypothetical protein
MGLWNPITATAVVVFDILTSNVSPAPLQVCTQPDVVFALLREPGLEGGGSI